MLLKLLQYHDPKLPTQCAVTLLIESIIILLISFCAYTELFFFKIIRPVFEYELFQQLIHSVIDVTTIVFSKF